ncbi:MAG: bifunctional 3-(3-hydroxy-phenyl)propionate/3-hydroxycinnamic acid hydroxylase [Burkholderiales bacterium]
MFDVAIVGCGPTGAILANLLGMLGLSVAVFERERGQHSAPRAVHFDGEVMRIFETAGLAAEISSVVRPADGAHFVNAAGRIMLELKPKAEGMHGWANDYSFFQPHLEQVLRQGVARFANVRVFTGHEVSAITTMRDCAQFTVTDSTREARQEKARWLVGCDGARSIVREAIGSALIDMGSNQSWIVVDVELQRDIRLPEKTTQYCDPARPVTYVGVTGRRRRWELMLVPGDDPEDIVREDRVWALLSPWIKPGDARIERSSVYTFHALLAERWRRGRLLIAGDAAHQMPPFLGQGMCAGIRDAANLAWKLGQVIAGGSDDVLLDSYQSEREAHVRVFIETAIRLGGIIQTLDPAVAADRDRRFEQQGTQEIVTLSPSLGPGAHDDNAPCGEIFPQPLLADGTRLDAAIGAYRFAVLARPALIDAALRARCAQANIALVSADGAVAAWLNRQGALAVMLRPDRYVQAVARDATDMDRLRA